MELTKQEHSLINFVRGLCFDDLLDAHEGITKKVEYASAMSSVKTEQGNVFDANSFKERADILSKLADLLCDANADYRAHINPEDQEPVKSNGVVQMIPINASEVIHLFEVMKKHGVTCSLEFNTARSLNPLIGISQVPVVAEYCEGGDEGDYVVVHIGDSEYSFDLDSHSFSKHVSDSQISICIANEDHAAWFNSGVVPSKGIEEANNYATIQEQYFAIDMRGDDIAESFESIADHLRKGWSISSISDCIGNDGHLYIDLVRQEGAEK